MMKGGVSFYSLSINLNIELLCRFYNLTLLCAYAWEMRWAGRYFDIIARGLVQPTSQKRKRIGHFQVPFSLSFKGSLSAKFLLW